MKTDSKPIDGSKVQAALDQATKELNTVTDTEFQARRFSGLRELDLAAKAIGLAEKHLAKATERTTKEAPAADAPAGDAPAAAAPAGGNKKK